MTTKYFEIKNIWLDISRTSKIVRVLIMISFVALMTESWSSSPFVQPSYPMFSSGLELVLIPLILVIDPVEVLKNPITMIYIAMMALWQLSFLRDILFPLVKLVLKYFDRDTGSSLWDSRLVILGTIGIGFTFVITFMRVDNSLSGNLFLSCFVIIPCLKLIDVITLKISLADPSRLTGDATDAPSGGLVALRTLLCGSPLILVVRRLQIN